MIFLPFDPSSLAFKMIIMTVKYFEENEEYEKCAELEVKRQTSMTLDEIAYILNLLER